MSLTSNITVVCPKCRHTNHIVKYDTINPKSSPNLRNRIIGGSIFEIECEKCHEKFSTLYPCMYYDADKKFKIYLRTKDSPSEPFGYNYNPEYIYRITDSFNDFREKVMIFDDGYNDKAIEFLKSFLVDRYQQGRKEKVIQTYYNGMQKGNLRFILYLNNNTYVDSFLPDSVLHKLTKDLEFEEVKGEYVVDKNWIKQFNA